jgi:hypothetical protein
MKRLKTSRRQMAYCSLKLRHLREKELKRYNIVNFQAFTASAKAILNNISLGVYNLSTELCGIKPGTPVKSTSDTAKLSKKKLNKPKCCQ